MDIVPPSGFFLTTANDQAPVSVTDGGISTVNFGLQMRQTLSGTVFDDDGTGGGDAADGVQNGSESGTNAGGLNVVIVDASDQVLAVAVVGAGGAWDASAPPARVTVCFLVPRIPRWVAV